MKGQNFDNRAALVSGESARSGVTGYRCMVFYQRAVEPGQDITKRVELCLEIVEPAPDVERRFSRVTRGGHNGGWGAGRDDDRPHRLTAAERQSALADAIEELEAQRADDRAHALVLEQRTTHTRRIHVTHNGHVLVENMRGDIELHQKAA